jgi:hypothetical protein
MPMTTLVVDAIHFESTAMAKGAGYENWNLTFDAK